MRALLAALLLAGAAAAQPLAELSRPFEAWDVAGSFYLVDRPAAVALCVGADRCEARTTPASTSKIFNALLALDAGVVGHGDTLRWDGVDRGLAAWNRDQTLRTAFQRSAVWAFEELVRRVGADETRAVYEREGYGNAETGPVPFWLTGPLAISPREQVAFLERLHDRRLGFSAAAMDSVVAFMELDRGTDADGRPWVLRGKTGWAILPGAQVGWLVGWVEREAGPAFFALRLRAPHGEDHPDVPMVAARPAILRALLAATGVLPAPPEDARR